jgi:hypothetical protein
MQCHIVDYGLSLDLVKGRQDGGDDDILVLDVLNDMAKLN